MKILRLTLALMVALWMAGVGCLLGCENMVSAEAAHEAGSPSDHLEKSGTPADATIVAAGSSCASMESHDCCAKRRGQQAAKSAIRVASKNSRISTSNRMTFAESGVAELSATSSMMMDCPLALNATAALSKAKPDPSSHSLTAASARDSLANSRMSSIALSPPLRLPNRGHTYLRCCVFLI